MAEEIDIVDEIPGTEAMASGLFMTANKSSYFLCVRNRGYAASLRLRTVYQSLGDAEAEAHGMLRIVEELGEDYLFPAVFFVPIEVPESAIHAFARPQPQHSKRRLRKMVADAG